MHYRLIPIKHAFLSQSKLKGMRFVRAMCQCKYTASNLESDKTPAHCQPLQGAKKNERVAGRPYFSHLRLAKTLTARQAACVFTSQICLKSISSGDAFVFRGALYWVNEAYTQAISRSPIYSRCAQSLSKESQALSPTLNTFLLMGQLSVIFTSVSPTRTW